VYNDLSDVVRTYDVTRRAFDRNITFHNGITVNIPVDGELGFNMLEMVKVKPFTEEGIIRAYQKLNDKYGYIRGSSDEVAKTSVVAGL
jgi:hypothetical protein